MTELTNITSDDIQSAIDADEIPRLSPALCLGGRVSREPHPGFPEEDNVTFLELIIHAPTGEDGEVIMTILPLVMGNDLADDLNLEPEVTLTRADLESDDQ